MCKFIKTSEDLKLRSNMVFGGVAKSAGCGDFFSKKCGVQGKCAEKLGISKLNNVAFKNKKSVLR